MSESETISEPGGRPATSPTALEEASGGKGTGRYDDAVPVVELVEITKRFPGVVANDRIDLSVGRGEVLCLLGENGAGKSTLMSILSGMLAPDSGAIRINGEEVDIREPREALDLGIGMVYQHSTLVPTLTVLENLMLGTTKGLRLRGDAARQRLEELAGILGAEIDPESLAGNLALGQQQVIEIIKALWKGTTVLILDEPTSMLTPRGVDELAKMLDRLKSHGIAVIFITHKLHEALRMGDRVVVLRQGRVAGRLSPEELGGAGDEEVGDRIIRLMFGEDSDSVGDVAELSKDVREVSEAHEPEASSAAHDDSSEDVALILRNVSLEPSAGSYGLHGIDLIVRRGEIVGVAGVDGNGQRELAEVIAGQRSTSEGDIILRDGATSKHVNALGVRGRQRLGLRYLTDDRHGEGVVHGMSVSLNLLLKRIGQKPFWSRGRIQRSRTRAYARGAIDEFDVRTPSSETEIGKLSGGNIQKVLLARELSFEPQVIVYNKPSYGLDVRTTQAIRTRIRDQASHGIAALVISTSLDELLELADRIAVMSKGRLVGTVDNGPGAEERIGNLMVGGVAT